MPHYTRREFAKFGLLTLPAAGLLSALPSLRAAVADRSVSGKPNSKVAGVQIGINVPYSFGDPVMSGDAILAACVQLGLSAVELRAQPVEAFLGAPPVVTPPRRAPGAAQPTAAERAAVQERAEALQNWRLRAPLARIADFRKNYEDAGVMIEILKIDGLFRLTDAVVDYCFAMAKGLGARALSSEISTSDEDLKRIGGFAEKHRMLVGYHGHATTAPALWEKAFALSPYNGANVDLGHFIAGNNTSPVPFITKYHDRITHVHIKDRKLHDGPNVPMGQGDTPVVEVLKLIRDQHWPIQATIEFEYPVPTGSTRMAEIAKVVQYCRDALA